VTTKKAKKAAPGRRTRQARRPFRQAASAWFTDASLRRWLLRFAIAGTVGFALLLFFVFVAYASVSLPRQPEQAETTAVLAADGSVLAELYTENREEVALDEVSEEMKQAVLAAEDRNFYRHSGVDPVGVGRALWNDIRRKSLQGGSTITQQLVKNQYLSSERTLTRKLKEAILSVKVERELDKDEILERYLNTVYFGRGAYGVEKAAEVFFGKDAADLELHEAALLAGLIRAPERADPERDPAAAERRRQLVLNALVRNGELTQAEADAAAALDLGTHGRRTPGDELKGTTGYFVEEVRTWAVRQFGERLAYGGGLRIETTLDPRMQAIAERVIYTDMAFTEEGDPDVALVTMDDTGAILAMIGGRDYATQKVNMAIGREGGNGGRQPGSTFKPFTLAAALEQGIPISTRYAGPAEMEVEFEGHPPYEVHNYENTGYGELDLASAMARSVNTTYAQLASDAGLENIVEVAGDLGIESEIEPFPAMSLGSEEVHPTELLRSYMTFATRGEKVEPHYVRRVLQKGNVVYEGNVRRDEGAYDQDYADVMNHVLRQVIESGTGTAARIGRPAAGKTGTTSNYVDAWFVGYTPTIGTAVWMGHKDDSLQQMDAVRGRRVSGGSFPAQIWGAYMREALDGIDTGDFEPPDPELLDARPADEPVEEETTTTTEDPEATTTSSTETTLPDDETTTTTTTEPDGGEATTTTSTTAPPETTTTTAASGGGGGGGPP
jgi:1A family penicillin-binding protein